LEGNLFKKVPRSRSEPEAPHYESRLHDSGKEARIGICLLEAFQKGGKG